ncbi:MAG: anaerobic ribonucleoside-triphosphate reductase activating protein [Candidatus Diapherotrites archaeon]
MDIAGLQKTTLIDYPGKVACTVFVAGCNFRCPYCHNPDLVQAGREIPKMPRQGEFFKFLAKRKKWLDGVCITGGEPTLNAELPEFIGKIKAEGFLVKLDTNGTNPKLLGELIKGGLVDYVAMDIKAPLEGYDKVVGVKVDTAAIKESAAMLMQGGVDYEFRTTVVPELFGEKEAREIAKWLKGAKKYYLQTFNPQVPLLDREFMKKKPYEQGGMGKLREIMAPAFGICGVREG